MSCILEDGRGHLWMSTNNGLSVFDPGKETFKSYSAADGLPGADLSGWGACSESPSGEMFFGGFSGGVAFHPDKVVDNPYVPPVVLTDFRIFDRPVTPRATRTADMAASVPDETNLTFSIEAIATALSNGGTRSWSFANSSAMSAGRNAAPCAVSRYARKNAAGFGLHCGRVVARFEAKERVFQREMKV